VEEQQNTIATLKALDLGLHRLKEQMLLNFFYEIKEKGH
jgi:hypothetical protein